MAVPYLILLLPGGRSDDPILHKRKRAPHWGPLSLAMEGLLAQTARDVAEDVLELVAEDDQNYADNDSDQDEDKGGLAHPLPILMVEHSANLVVEVGKHWLHLLSKRLRLVWHSVV